MFRCVNHLYKDLFIFYNMSACNKNLTTNFDFVNVYFVFAAKTHQNYEYYLIFLDTRLVVLSSIWNRYRLKRNIIQTINLPNPKRKEESEYEYSIEYFRTEYWLPIDKRYRFLMRGRNKRKMRVTKVNKVKKMFELSFISSFTYWTNIAAIAEVKYIAAKFSFMLDDFTWLVIQYRCASFCSRASIF